MRIQFLGTAASEGWPAVFCQCEACKKAKELGGKNIRSRSSCIIEDKYMIDFPPDTFMHMINNKLDLAKIQHLFITHSHEDHFYPEDLFTRQQPYAHIDKQYLAPMNIYGNSTVKKEFNKLGGEKNSNGSLKFQELKPFQHIKLEGAEVYTLLADHKPDEQCLLYIIKIGNKTLLYGHDSGYFPERSWKEIAKHKIDGVIFDCTFGFKEMKKGHMGFSAALEIKDRMLRESIASENTKYIIAHFSHNVGLLHEEIEKKAGQYGFITAYDGMVLEI